MIYNYIRVGVRPRRLNIGKNSTKRALPQLHITILDFHLGCHMKGWEDPEQSIREIAVSLREPRAGCILFVGSGMSVEAGLATGRGLAEKLAEEIDYPLPTQAKLEEAVQQRCRECPQAGDLLEELKKEWSCYGLPESLAIIAQYFENESPGHREKLVDLLRDLLERAELWPTHELVTKLPFKAIYTTNYDTLLEDAYQQAGIEHSVITHDGLRRPRGLKLVKLHGTVGPHCDEDLIVITDNDYQNLKMEKQRRTRVLENMARDLASYHVVFVGYSLQDNYFREMYHHVRELTGRYGKRCWAVIPEFHEYQAKDWADRYKVIFIKRKANEFFRELKEQYDKITFSELTPLAGEIEQATSQAEVVWSVSYEGISGETLWSRIMEFSEWVAERHHCVSVNWAESLSSDPLDSYHRFFDRIVSASQRCKTGALDSIPALSDKLSDCRKAAVLEHDRTLIKGLKRIGFAEDEIVRVFNGDIEAPEEIRLEAMQAREDVFLHGISRDLMACLENLSKDKHLFLLFSGFESATQGQNAVKLLEYLMKEAVKRSARLSHVTLILLHKLDRDTSPRYPKGKVRKLELLTS